MLHIILLLKIIGILLLSVLGLILLILLTTLLVPVRYRVAIEHGEKLFYMKGRVNWLLHIVHLSISHIEGILHIQARLFGFVLYDNLKPVKQKKEKKPKTVKRKAVKSKTVKSKTVKKNTVKNNNANGMTADSKAPVPRQLSSSSPEEVEVKASKPVSENKTSSDSRKVDTSGQKEISKQEDLIGKDAASVHKIAIEQKEPKGEHKSFFRKLLEHISRIRDKIVSVFIEWKIKIGRIFATVSSLRVKLELIMNFLRDEMNKEGMHLTFSSLKRLLKHILPTKLKSKMIFGTGDPCSTGQALGAISILYSFYGDKLQITPDFEREVLEGKHSARGRIRLVTVLIIVVKLIFDKRFKQLKNNFIILKEAL